MKGHYRVLAHEGVGAGEPDFSKDVERGLSGESKKLPSRYFYDYKGGDLFSQPEEFPESHLWSCEHEILQNHKEDITRVIGIKQFNVVGLGCGDAKKSMVLIRHFLHSSLNVTYFPIDGNESAMKNLIEDFDKDRINVKIEGVVSELFDGVTWLTGNAKGPNVVLFLGSSIGNYNPSEAERFLHRLRNALNDGDFLLIGFDLNKDVSVLNKAHDNSSGIATDFNLNMLARINRELGGEFKPGQFKYYGGFNEKTGAVESHLVSQKEQKVRIKSIGKTYSFSKGETIQTGSSYKFTEGDIFHLANRAGFDMLRNYTDSKGYFVDSLWQVKKKASKRRRG